MQCLSNCEVNKTFSSQVFGVSEYLQLDPDSQAFIVFKVQFPTDFSTACLERVQCHQCSVVHDANCGTFFEDRAVALKGVRDKLYSFRSETTNSSLTGHAVHPQHHLVAQHRPGVSLRDRQSLQRQRDDEADHDHHVRLGQGLVANIDPASLRL